MLSPGKSKKEEQILNQMLPQREISVAADPSVAHYAGMGLEWVSKVLMVKCHKLTILI